MTNKDLFFKLKLLRTGNIGPVSYLLIIQRYKNAEKGLRAIQNDDYWLNNKSIQIPSDQDIYDEIIAHDRIGAKLIHDDHEHYPSQLKKHPWASPILSVLGNVELLHKKSLGVVGTRHPSIIGEKFCKTIVQRWKKQFVIISGLAIGLDTIAHENSLDVGTIGVIPCGLGCVYPKENEVLYKLIKEKGCLVSSFSFYSPPKPQTFLQRNKLVAALSSGIVVIEAAKQSGSLQTANFALSLKKSLFVVPGHPMDNHYTGNNYLIQQGANILYEDTDINHIINSRESILMDIEQKSYEIDLDKADLEELHNICKYISITPVSIYDIVTKMSLSINKILSLCVKLELNGIIHIFPNFYVQLIKELPNKHTKK